MVKFFQYISVKFSFSSFTSGLLVITFIKFQNLNHSYLLECGVNIYKQLKCSVYNLFEKWLELYMFFETLVLFTPITTPMVQLGLPITRYLQFRMRQILLSNAEVELRTKSSHQFPVRKKSS